MFPDFQLAEYITHHVINSQEWHLPFLPTIHFPEWFSLHGMMLLICSALLIFLFIPIYRKTSAEAPKGITNLLESFILFIRDEISVACLGEKDGIKFAPVFLTFFFFILGLNLIGLVPHMSTATANVNVTGALALITLSIMIIGGIMKHGLKGFFQVFMPHGVPTPILIILFPIEFAGLFIKAFALMIRLFANLLAGHIVIFSLLGLIVVIGLSALPAVFLALFIYLLEILVAFLQAYIFTFLSAMFTAQVLHPEH